MQASQLEREGHAVIQTNLAKSQLQILRDSVFTEQGPGQRCLLDQPIVKQTAVVLRSG